MKKQIKLKNGEIKEMTFEEVHKQFQAFIYKQSKQFLAYFDGDLNEAIQVGNIALFKAYRTYERLDIQFMTYMGRVVTNDYLMAIRKIKRKGKEVSLETVLSTDESKNKLTIADTLSDDIDVEREVINKEITRDIFEGLTEKEIDLVNQAAFNIGTQAELAEKYNVTQSYISRLQKKLLMKLRKKIEIGGDNVKVENRDIAIKATELLKENVDLKEIKERLYCLYPSKSKNHISTIIYREKSKLQEVAESTEENKQKEKSKIKVNVIPAEMFNKAEITAIDNGEIKGNDVCKSIETPKLVIIKKSIEVKGMYGVYESDGNTVKLQGRNLNYECIDEVIKERDKRIKEIMDQSDEILEVFKLAANQ